MKGEELLECFPPMVREHLREKLNSLEARQKGIGGLHQLIDFEVIPSDADCIAVMLSFDVGAQLLLIIKLEAKGENHE